MYKRTVSAEKTSLDNSVSWKIRPFRDGDEQKAVPLFNSVFSKSITIDHYRWKVVDTPWPIGTATTWVADTGKELAGQYAGTSMRFWLKGKVLKIVHVCDVMTHPGFRKQGILTALGTTAHKNWQEKGILFVTGFHHRGWGTRREYLNWQALYKSTWMWRPLLLDEVIKSRINLPGFVLKIPSALENIISYFHKAWLKNKISDIQVSQVNSANEEFDILWDILKVNYEAAVVRDREWVDYRYLKSPQFNYQVLIARRSGNPVGYLTYRVREHGHSRIGYIADIFTHPEDYTAHYALIQECVDRLRKAGAKSVLSVVSKNTSQMKIFHRFGFIPRYGTFDVSIVPLRKGLPMDILKGPSRWYSMGGDFDIV